MPPNLLLLMESLYDIKVEKKSFKKREILLQKRENIIAKKKGLMCP
jgi:hypothetical protein